MPEPIELNVPTTIQSVSCGHQFAVLLSYSGILFSFGENLYGELGLGDEEMRITPE